MHDFLLVEHGNYVEQLGENDFNRDLIFDLLLVGLVQNGLSLCLGDLRFFDHSVFALLLDLDA